MCWFLQRPEQPIAPVQFPRAAPAHGAGSKCAKGRVGRWRGRRCPEARKRADSPAKESNKIAKKRTTKTFTPKTCGKQLRAFLRNVRPPAPIKRRSAFVRNRALLGGALPLVDEKIGQWFASWPWTHDFAGSNPAGAARARGGRQTPKKSRRGLVASCSRRKRQRTHALGQKENIAARRESQPKRSQ